jgi:hypothetical protein
MNRRLLVFLVIIAAGLYSYVAFLLTGGTHDTPAKKSSTNITKNISIDNLVLHSVMVHFKKSDRDPFLPYEEKPVQTVVKNEKPKGSLVPVIKKEPPKPPSIIITGIMWNPTSPVAMVTMPNGANTVAKTGVTIDEITFRKIEKNRIQVTSNGKDFWIDR